MIDGLALERGCAAIEDENGLDADEEELAYSAKETDNMTAAQCVALLIAHSFEKLVDPYRGVDGDAPLVQRLDFNGPRAGLQDSPEAGDTHGNLLRIISIEEGVSV